MTMDLQASNPITVIWNPSSGAEDRAEVMLADLRQWPETTIERPTDAKATAQLIDELGDSPGLLVAAGGDGTVRTVVDAMMASRSKKTLGILPLGTGNDLCRTLEIPFEPLGALQVLKNGELKGLDVFEFETRQQHGWCANMITGGNTGRCLEVMTDEIKTRWGVFCYARGVVDVLQNLQVFEVTVQCDDQPSETISALNVFLANGRTSGGGMVVSPDAGVDSGKADVVIVREGEPVAIAKLTANYFVSDYREHELIVFRQGAVIHLDAQPPLPLTADGDSIGESPLKMTVHPQALQVRVPGPQQVE